MRELSPEDYHCVKLYILLPLIISAFERDKAIATNTFKTADPYVALITQAIRRAETDHRLVRIRFRKIGLKVYEQQNTEQGIRAKYLYRGYHYDFSMLWSLIAAECRVWMEKYLGLDIQKYVKTGEEMNFVSPSEW
ncbi:hypothetical protein [Bacillus sp. FSL K6-6540]|uniref:hypothetical protein n=1 Tax=Bacillus sp. FSL K6-6540 TaxID=2921512 RepID=UPI0030FCD91A